MDNVEDYIASQPKDKKWTTSGQIVITGAQVYGHRVEHIHNETYKMWNGMQRNATMQDDLDNIQEEEEDQSKDNEEGKKKQQKRHLKYKGGDGEKTLVEPKEITLKKFDASHEADPLFRKTTQKFDEMSIGSLMSSTLQTSSNLLLQLDSRMAYQTE